MKLKKIIAAGKKYITRSDYRFLFWAGRGGYHQLSDEEYLKRFYQATMGMPLNLDNPKTFNEKLQWLKLYDRRPEYTMMVDKYLVREHIANKLGKEYLIPLLGVWDTPEDIDFDMLPNQFVLKCNHNSGLGMCICNNKTKLNINKVKKELYKGLKQNYYLTGREWPYKNVPRKIIAEKYMREFNTKEKDLKDYKLMCFNGEVKCSFVCSDRFSSQGLHVTFFDREWNIMPFERHYPHIEEGLPKPINYEKMIELAEILSKDIPFVRVDFYEINRKIYFGELTFFPGSGMEKFEPEAWDYKLGEWLVLPN